MSILDHELSKRYCTAVIFPSKAIGSTLLTKLSEDEAYWQRREGKKSNHSYYRLRPLHAFRLLQELACAGGIMYKDRAIICDFFSKHTLEFLVDNGTISTFLEYDLILQGPPHAIIKDNFLRFFDPEISWQTITFAKSCPKTILPKELEKLRKELLDEKIELVEFQSAPVAIQPVLELVDSTLGFANLYVEGERLKYEKELTQAGFMQKPMGRSNYFCPLDRTQKALLTLLKAGWKVLDCQKREIVAQKAATYCLDMSKDHFIVDAQVEFGDEKVALQPALKNEKLVGLDNNRVGLLEHDPQFLDLLHHVEIISERMCIKKAAVGMLQDMTFTSSDAVKQELIGHVHALDLSDFNGTLRGYQNDGVKWLLGLFNRNFSALLADEMGLGKTVQVLAFLSMLKGKSLIVVPTTLMLNWQKEIQKFLPNTSVNIYHGPDRKLTDSAITITSFGMARSDYALLSKTYFSCLVIDEAQSMKNRETLTFQSLQKLNAQFRLSLTGTPIENSVAELVTHFSFLQPNLISDDDAIYDIRKKVRPFFLRRKKVDVAKDLPEKVEQTVLIPMEPSQKELYTRFLHTARQGLIQKISVDGLAKHRMEVFEAILRLRQICCHSALIPQLVSELGFDPHMGSCKYTAVLDDIETLLAEGKKVVLFSQFATMLQHFSKEALQKDWKHLLLDGKTQNRQDLVERFQNDPEIQLFFISLKAGGVGLNLTRADYVLLYDPWWNRSQEQQAIDRAHRIGRQGTVFAKRYVVADSIEEKILTLQERKIQLFDQVLEEEFSDSPHYQELADLILF